MGRLDTPVLLLHDYRHDAVQATLRIRPVFRHDWEGKGIALGGCRVALIKRDAVANAFLVDSSRLIIGIYLIAFGLCKCRPIVNNLLISSNNQLITPKQPSVSSSSRSLLRSRATPPSCSPSSVAVFVSGYSTLLDPCWENHDAGTGALLITSNSLHPCWRHHPPWWK